MERARLLAAVALAGLVLAGSVPAGRDAERGKAPPDSPVEPGAGGKIVKTDAEWKRILTPEQYRVMRLRDTELACSGPWWDHHEAGTYVCAACDAPLFSSKTKFDSGTGWPSYWEPVSKDAVGTEEDRSFGIVRTEVHCARCGGHLGHVFEDGPMPTGLRYCINSVSLRFTEAR